jgi:hypothetical protein
VCVSGVSLTVTVSTRSHEGAEVTEPAVRRPKAGVKERGEITIASARRSSGTCDHGLVSLLPRYARHRRIQDRTVDDDGPTRGDTQIARLRVSPFLRGSVLIRFLRSLRSLRSSEDG